MQRPSRVVTERLFTDGIHVTQNKQRDISHLCFKGVDLSLRGHRENLPAYPFKSNQIPLSLLRGSWKQKPFNISSHTGFSEHTLELKAPGG